MYGLGSTFSINEIVTPEENYKLVKYECINNNNNDEDSSFFILLSHHHIQQHNNK